MKTRGIIAFMLVGTILMVSIVTYIITNSNNQRDENWNTYANFKFKGVIIKKTNFKHGSCLVKLHLSYSNINEHDVRGEHKQSYLCVIKDSLAEVIVRKDNVEIGDSLMFKNNVLTVYSKNEIKKQYVPQIFWSINSAKIKRSHDL